MLSGSSHNLNAVGKQSQPSFNAVGKQGSLHCPTHANSIQATLWHCPTHANSTHAILSYYANSTHAALSYPC